jgi:hypothetical protein
MKKYLAFALCAFATIAAFAGAEPVPPTSLLIDFGASSLSGAGRQIQVTNVPVTNGSTTTYYNADLEFQFLSDGSLAAVVTSASVAAGPASSQSSSNFNFLPGTYKDAGSGCLWTLSTGGIGSDGARTYTFTKNDLTCYAALGWTSYTWSTAPGPTNSFAQGSATQRAIYPTDVAFGLNSSGSGIRAVASGASVSITGYTTATGLAYGNLLSFVKQ